MEFRKIVTVYAHGKAIGYILASCDYSPYEIMWELGYDINNRADCMIGYKAGISGFYIDGNGIPRFDTDCLSFRSETVCDNCAGCNPANFGKGCKK